MNNQVNTTEIKITDSIIIKITGQELIDMGHYIGEDLPEQKFNLHINISEQKIQIAPDVDGGSFDHTYEFDYAETLSDLSEYDHLPNGICGGIEYWYNDDCAESSSSCNPSEIAYICGLSDNELEVFDSLDHLNSFFTLGTFSFSYEPQYIAQIDVHIDMDAKKITMFNSRKGIYETVSFGESCIEDTMDEDDLKEYFQECYPDNNVNIIFL